MTKNTFSAPKISDAVRIITKAVKSQGNYSKDLSLTIIKAAGDYVAYSKALADLDNLEHCYYETKSREGNPDYKEHPVIKQLPTLSKALERSLASLGLTLETLSVNDTDPLTSMMSKIEEA